MKSSWSNEVLRFWFEELEPRRWFERDASVDATIRERFAALHGEVRVRDAGEFDSPPTSLAAVIVLDQFPRNMFRDSPRAFATDALALSVSSGAIDRGFDRELSGSHRTFLYMPWQHSEDRSAQARSVELFAQLGDERTLDYARQHKDIIDRFGRFPHRNAVLQRTSTSAELEFLKTHPGF